MCAEIEMESVLYELNGIYSRENFNSHRKIRWEEEEKYEIGIANEILDVQYKWCLL